jgi:hypothetical protein
LLFEIGLISITGVILSGSEGSPWTIVEETPLDYQYDNTKIPYLKNLSVREAAGPPPR